jgi:hypothetical protein
MIRQAPRWADQPEPPYPGDDRVVEDDCDDFKAWQAQQEPPPDPEGERDMDAWIDSWGGE